MRKKRFTLIFVILTVGMVLFSNSFIFAQSENQAQMKIQIASCKFGNLKDVIFDGTEKKPEIVIHDGEKRLKKGEDFTVIYTNNVDAGKAEVIITGKDGYTGKVKKTFRILKREISIKASHASSSGKPKISWKKVKGAAAYEVRWARYKNGTYKKLKTTKQTTFVHQDAIRGTRYFYKVLPIDKNEKKRNFEKSNIAEIVCKLASPKVTAQNRAKTGKPFITWTKVKGAEKYAVYRSLSKNGKYSCIFTTTKTDMLNKSAKAGKTYYYKVKAVDLDNRAADSLLSKKVRRTCDLNRPVIKTLNLTAKAKPKLTWKKIAAAESYEVYRAKKKNGTYQKIGTTKKLSFVDKNAKGGKSYYYRICAVDASNKDAKSAKSMKVKIYVVNLNKKLVALTFDDGPGPYTEEIVDVLKKHHARATFFVLGQRVKSYQSELRAIHQGGNEIGNHSYSHPILTYVSKSEIKSQMNRTDNAIKDVIGIKPKLMRPPGGGVDSTVQSTVGKPIIYWSIDTRDWETRSKSETIRCVMDEVSDGDIVLMHDIHEPTMEAAVELIPKLKHAGYELVTVSELAKFKGKKLKDGVVYYSF